MTIQEQIREVLWEFHNELKDQQDSGRSVTQGNAEIIAVFIAKIHAFYLAELERMLPDEALTCEYREIKIGNQWVKEIDSRYNAGYNTCLTEIKAKFKAMGKEE